MRPFSRNAVLRTDRGAQNMRDVENRGITLLRGELVQVFSQKSAPYVRTLNGLVGRFPFLRPGDLQRQRERFARGELYSKVSGGQNVSIRIELPTIGASDINGTLPGSAPLVDEYSLEKILSGEEKELDFVQDEKRAIRTAWEWNRFLYGAPLPGGPATRSGAPARVHKVDLQLLSEAGTPGRAFIGKAAGLVTLFGPKTIMRPSTDARSGQRPTPFEWRLSTADGPLSVKGTNEGGTRSSGTLEIVGGPLRFFYYVQVASDEERRADQDGRRWNVRVEIPEPGGAILGAVFELIVDDAVPGVMSD
jgi:hypothetical protein